MNIEKTDPRLTAYVCGELADADRAEFEKLLAADAELQQLIAGLRATAGSLSAELQREARDMSLSVAQRAAILNPRANRVSRWQKFNDWLSTPRMVLGGAAAVCLLLAIVSVSVLLTRPRTLTPEQLAALPKPDMSVFEPHEVTVAETPPPPLEESEIASIVDDNSLFALSNSGSLTLAQNNTYPDLSSRPVTFVLSPRSNSSSLAADSHKVGADYANAPASVSSVSAPPPSAAPRRELKRNTNNSFAGGYVISGGTNTAQLIGGAAAIGCWKPHDMSNSNYYTPADGETYLQKPENPWVTAAQEPLSTFSIDVDTASYSNLRRFLAGGQLPPADAVRVEELLNYFTYDYPQPADGRPFSVTTELARCPWDASHQLLRVGLRGKDVTASERPRLSLVFLVDVSGSMDAPNRLPLVKRGLALLVGKLRPTDRIAIVTYAGESRLALPSTPVSKRDAILSAIDSLRAGGSTNGEGGIRMAYQIARDNFIASGANRIILCTDGDFNVGDTGEESLSAMVQRQAKGGVFLNVYGFGMGNYKDRRLVQLADNGNGVYGYIDSFPEAQKIFSKQLTGTLITIAKDVKIQVDFNPAKVGAYRLIGYEKRALAKEDFTDDRKDAGEIGAGHTVTALYEIAPPGTAADRRVEPSKYIKAAVEAVKETFTNSDELATVRLRYKLPKEDTSTPFNVTVSAKETQSPSADFKFAAAIAMFADALKNPTADHHLPLALKLATEGKGTDTDNYRGEFIRLLETAKDLKKQ